LKKVRIFLSILIAAVVLSLFAAHADSPAPPNYFYTYVTNAGSNVKYTDVLIKLNKDSNKYTKLNTNTPVHNFTASTPIVAYDKDGYMSISFHLNENESDLGVHSQAPSEKDGCVQLYYGDKPISAITDSIKVALLDKDGNILKISDAVNIKQADRDSFPRGVRYDAKSDTPAIIYSGYYHSSTPQVFFTLLILLFLARMVISTAIETLTAIPFKIRPLWKIFAVNIATQILLFVFTTFSGLSYTTCVIFGEVFVYTAEFVAYIFLFKRVSKGTLLFYTVVANTASLAVGLIFNYFHILVI
jgi:hypothetical protein